MPEGDAVRTGASQTTKGPVEAVLEGPIDALELTPPPSQVHLKVLPAGDGCWLLAWVTSGDRQPVARWLEETHGFEIVRRPAARRRLLVSRSRVPPTPLHVLAQRSGRFDLRTSPDGQARLQVKTDRQEIEALAAVAEESLPGLRLTRVDPVDEGNLEDVVTGRQHDALTQALASGYFDVPRRIRLADLADAMDMSQSSLSELLRRAQRRLVEGYIDATPELGVRLEAGQTQWSSSRKAPRPWTRPPEEDS